MDTLNTPIKNKRPSSHQKLFFLAVIFLAVIFFQEKIGEKFVLNQGGGKSIDEPLTLGGQVGRIDYVLGEEAVNSEDEDSVQGYISEDFVIDQLTVGGGDGNGNLSISSVKSDLVTTDEDNEKRVLISWRTSKPALGKVEYEKNGEADSQVISEDDLSYSHSIAVGPLDPSTLYSYKIKSVDELGEMKESQPFVFYSGAKKASLVDVLKDATEKLFGWAIK